MGLKLVPDNTKIPFTRWRMLAFGGSAVAVLASFVALLTLGLNFGIDFRGGGVVEIGLDEPVDIGRLRSVVGELDLGDVKVQEFGSPEVVVIYFEQQTGGEGVDEDVAQSQAMSRIRNTLVAEYGESVVRREESVGGTVSAELTQRGAMAVLLAVALMLIYIWLRFEWQFSLGAVAALVHDVVLTMGVFAVTRIEFNLSIIAAILTIVGYSMNDTVVVYDRVRENLRKFKKKPLVEVLDLSINDTLSRTVMTSGTTLLALAALYAFGGEVLRGFTFAMIWGIVVGTYSSIFIAAPFLLLTDVKRDWSKAAAEA